MAVQYQSVSYVADYIHPIGAMAPFTWVYSTHVMIVTSKNHRIGGSN